MMRHHARGFSFIELLISAAMVALAAMAAVAHITRSSQGADWTRDRIFARQKAMSILSELRAYVEGGEGEVAADLDGFDDGVGTSPSLTIQPDPNDPGAFLQPAHHASGNITDDGTWRWQRQITVQRFPGINTRDLRICTVRMYRQRTRDESPMGEKMAEVSGVIRTIGDAYPTTQVYDVYLLALDNVPGWWVFMDAIQPFVQATLTDLEGRNPGLRFRTHWITKTGYGRDEEYAPYTNEALSSTDSTPWAYVYPGKMPAGQAAQRYYVADRFSGRVNVDGTTTPQFVNGLQAMETFTDQNANGRRDAGEPYTDANGNGTWDKGNPVPHAVADMHNHAMRAPDAQARFAARVAAGQDRDDEPTWHILLDRMISQPDRYHNAILINLHGELLPMPPVRNYSDAASIPDVKAGWRAVTHPEWLRPIRVQGSDTASTPLAWRVYAYKTEWTGPAGTEKLTTQQEHFVDANGNGVWDVGEMYSDWNANGVHDGQGVPIFLRVRGGRFDQNVNGTTAPSLTIQRLAGGIDADGNGTADAYVDWTNAARYPEAFTDSNGDGRRQVAETWLDLDGDGIFTVGEPWQDLDGDGAFTATTETLIDYNGNGRYDTAAPADIFTDSNGNGRWDAAEPYWDVNEDGVRNGPTVAPAPAWRPWNPAIESWTNPTQVAAYVASYGEPFSDLNGNNSFNAAEPLVDGNGNGVFDGGFRRGEMWYEIRYDGADTLIWLYGTPLETPYLSGTQRGLPDARRLYELDYIPCPTPSSSSTGGDRFARDLYAASSDRPKNTARWRLVMPPAAVRRGFELSPGANNGDTIDRVVTVETRFGFDATTGTMWPTRHHPRNRSATYAWFADSVEDVPFSERYQFQGDPRHSPYADCDRFGTTSRNGYNMYFDDFNDSTNAQSWWLAFDSTLLRHAWMGDRGSSVDVPRIMSWLRYALVRNEAIYTTLTGFSYYYLSVGGDVGYDDANGFPTGIPVDGAPYASTSDLYENTIIPGVGSSSITGSLKHVRSNTGGSASRRTSTGYWWSMPWLGENCPDGVYASQWQPWGNLRASATGGTGTFSLIRRGDLTTAQQPVGTRLTNSFARLADEGSTSFFNIGSTSSTFHHQFGDGQSGSLVEDGPQLAENYNFPLPTSTKISRPFALNVDYSGGVGPEFNLTTEFPRFSASLVRRFYNHEGGTVGSALVRLREPGTNARGGYIVVNGIDRTTESGSAFIARYSLLSLIHSYFAGGVSSPNRVKQLPRTQIEGPTLLTELENPTSIPVSWKVEWKRWDGLKYTSAYSDTFSENESDLAYVLLYSPDGGRTWKNMMNDSIAEPGVLPWNVGAGTPDWTRVLPDSSTGNELWNWSTPVDKFGKGSYLIRVESYRRSEPLHYSQHMEKIYVNR